MSRSLKILKVLGLNYENCIRRFYHQNPHLKELSYEKHLEALENYFPVHLNSFRKEMSDLGYEANVALYDLQSLQFKWAEENGFKNSVEHWRVDILLAQIKHYQPDILYLQDIHSMPHFVRKRIRELTPSIRKVVLFKGFPGALNELADIDLVFAGTPLIQKDYQDVGLHTDLLYHSYDKRISSFLDSSIPKPFTFSFVGYSGYGGFGNYHLSRYKLLRKMAEETSLRFWISENASHKAPHPEAATPFQQLFPDRTQPGCFGLEMYRIINDSEIVFNRHTDAAYTMVGNMRLFEATGVGSCLLTDNGANLKDLFEPDYEVVTYQSDEECIEKAEYLENNLEAAREIAKNGQRRTLKQHTLAHRCQQIDEAIQKLF